MFHCILSVPKRSFLWVLSFLDKISFCSFQLSNSMSSLRRQLQKGWDVGNHLHSRDLTWEPFVELFFAFPFVAIASRDVCHDDRVVKDIRSRFIMTTEDAVLQVRKEGNLLVRKPNRRFHKAQRNCTRQKRNV